MAEKKSFVNLDNTKGRPDSKYSNVINQIQKDGVCPFCHDQLKNYHKNPIEYETDYWILTRNMYPYEGARIQLLLIHKKHITSPQEMSDEAWMDLRYVIKKAHELHNIPGGTLVHRFGDTRYTGASVAHLHANLVSSDPDKADYKPIIARVG